MPTDNLPTHHYSLTTDNCFADSVSNRAGRVQTLVRKPAAFLLSAFFALIPFAGLAQSGSFTVSQHGKPVGTASFNFTVTPKGYDSSSVVRVDMQGLNYAISKTETLDAANHLKRVQLSATVNSSAVNVVGKLDAAQFLLNISANGRSTTTPLPFHAAAVFLPDFDPGALETLLALAVTHNSRGLWAIVPKQAGSVVPIQLATYADEHGALDGKPLVVHHLTATISGQQTELFSGPHNQLLQAELPDAGFALVRKGFVLTPPAKAGAAPQQPLSLPTQPQQTPQ